MGNDTLSRDVYAKVHAAATAGGTRSATHHAEERLRAGHGLDPMVNPKGPANLGPVRLSLPRFEKVGETWELTRGLPMAIETVLDTTGSMQGNVDRAFHALPLDYALLTEGDNPLLGRYDVQIATATFNDTEDPEETPVFTRSQFEMAEKIAEQIALQPPGRGGQGNGKEDPQFALFGGAYLTQAAINRWGLRYYHFMISDEPLLEYIDLTWLKRIFGDDVLERAKANGHDFSEGIPGVPRIVQDLQKNAHAFFLQVGKDGNVRDQWTKLYGRDHVVAIGTTDNLHFVKAVIIGLTEGRLDLGSAAEFLVTHGLDSQTADSIVRSVSHIPLGAQTLAENFDKIPLAGAVFMEKTDLWPVDPNKLPLVEGAAEDETGGDNWV